jgi:hypothetical protein
MIHAAANAAAGTRKRAAESRQRLAKLRKPVDMAADAAGSARNANICLPSQLHCQRQFESRRHAAVLVGLELECACITKERGQPCLDMGEAYAPAGALA